MTVRSLGQKRSEDLQRTSDLNNLFAQVVSPYGSLHLFGARPVHLSDRYAEELVGRRVPQMWRRGKLANRPS